VFPILALDNTNKSFKGYIFLDFNVYFGESPTFRRTLCSHHVACSLAWLTPLSQTWKQNVPSEKSGFLRNTYICNRGDFSLHSHRYENLNCNNIFLFINICIGAKIYAIVVFVTSVVASGCMHYFWSSGSSYAILESWYIAWKLF
jgi:hypothetical protein